MSSGASGGMRPVFEKKLKMARALAKRKGEPTSEELLKARQMARDGATYEEIRVALNYDVTPDGFANIMKKFNIRPWSTRVHRGKSPRANGYEVIASGAVYKPKKV